LLVRCICTGALLVRCICTGACAPVPDGRGVCCMQSRSKLELHPMQPPHGGGVLAGGPEWSASTLYTDSQCMPHAEPGAMILNWPPVHYTSAAGPRDLSSPHSDCWPPQILICMCVRQECITLYPHTHAPDSCRALCHDYVESVCTRAWAPWAFNRLQQVETRAQQTSGS